MRLLYVVLLGMSTHLVAAPLNAAANLDWSVLRRQATEESRRGSLAKAEQLLHDALQSLPSQESSAGVILWNELGSVHHDALQLGDAQEDLKRALAINSRLPQPDYAESAVALNTLAAISGEKHDAKSAESLLREAQNMLLKADRPHEQTNALIESNLALTLTQQGRYAEARTLYQRAVASIRQLFGERSIEYSRTLTNLSLFKYQLGEYRESLNDSMAAAAIQRQLSFVSDSDKVVNLNVLGLASHELSRLEQARTAFLEAIRLEERMPGGKPPTVHSLNNLAAVELRALDYERAKQHVERAMELKKAGVNVDDLTLAALSNTLGRIFTAEKKFGEARREYEHACELLKHLNGPQRSQLAATRSNMGNLETAEHHFKKAESHYREAWEIDSSVLGETHPASLSDTLNIAAALFYQKRNQEALQLYEGAETLVERNFGPQSVEAARLWRNIGVVYSAERRHGPAVLAHRKAVEILDGFSGGKDVNLPLWLRDYATALRNDQKWGEAEAAETRALGIEVRKTLASQKQAPRAEM
jgi:tetratricopeptide (TPR) repeat protein